MADGWAWVGITVKPNVIKSLKRFDAERYGALSMPHPVNGPTCDPETINSWSHPTTPADETGLAWDMLTQLGLLLKSDSAKNPLRRPAQSMYMTGQSQTAGYSRTYATVFARPVAEKRGEPLYDGFLYAGSPPWQVPLHQCMASFEPGDPRLITGAAGVPVIGIFAQGDMATNIESRRADSDEAPDLYRRYEVTGAPHVDPWEQRSFPSSEDMMRAAGASSPIAGPECEPVDAPDSDFPNRYVFNAAWRHLHAWAREGKPAPRAPRLELVAKGAEDFHPTSAFATDEHGNARSGLRTPYIDVPTATWIGSKTPDFSCMFQGYKLPFDAAKLQSLYPSHDDYVAKVRASVEKLQAQGWLTDENADEIIRDAEEADIP
jgi:hypothetical protein